MNSINCQDEQFNAKTPFLILWEISTHLESTMVKIVDRKVFYKKVNVEFMLNLPSPSKS